MQMQFPESYAKIAKRLWYMSFSNNLFEGNLAPLRVGIAPEAAVDQLAGKSFMAFAWPLHRRPG